MTFYKVSQIRLQQYLPSYYKISMSNIQRQILLFISLFLQVLNYPLCPDIELSGYNYQLSQLATLNNILALSGNTIIQISPCQSFVCSRTSDSQQTINETTFVGKRTSTSCFPYTSKIAPLKQYYALINSENPKIGIKMKFPPFYNAQILYDTEIDILCKKIVLLEDPNLSLKTTCTELETNEETQKFTLKCTMYSQYGCPLLATNHFWMFLINSKIIFAIVLWIVALFLLFFGYLAIRGTIFIFGIFSGTIFALILSADNYTNFITESNGVYIYIICLSFFLGITFGITLLTIPKLGYANIGIWVAAIFSLLLQNSVFYLTGSNLALYITFGVTALIMIVISMLQLKYYIILCSSFVGGFWMIRPLGFFLPYYPNQLSSARNFTISIETPWQFYLYLLSIIILTVLGIAFQVCLYKKTRGKYQKSNEAYYLQREGDIKDKLKKIFQFKEIRELVKAGRNELVQLRDLVLDKTQKQSEQQSIKEEKVEEYIEMSDFGRKKSYQKHQKDRLVAISDVVSQDQVPALKKKTRKPNKSPKS